MPIKRAFFITTIATTRNLTFSRIRQTEPAAVLASWRWCEACNGRRYLRALTAVYKETGTLWENYAPESFERGNISRGDFVGWTGCGPIALLIENILGLRANAAENLLIWHITRTDRHGLKNLRLGDTTVSLVCEERMDKSQPLKINVKSDGKFQLKIVSYEKTWQQEMVQGEQDLSVLLK